MYIEYCHARMYAQFYHARIHLEYHVSMINIKRDSSSRIYRYQLKQKRIAKNSCVAAGAIMEYLVWGQCGMCGEDRDVGVCHMRCLPHVALPIHLELWNVL